MGCVCLPLIQLGMSAWKQVCHQLVAGFFFIEALNMLKVIL